MIELTAADSASLLFMYLDVDFYGYTAFWSISAFRRTSMTYREDSIPKHFSSNSSNMRPYRRRNPSSDKSFEQSVADLKIKEGYVFKGIVGSEPAEPRACGCVQPPTFIDQVAPYAAIENISVQKLTPEYKDWHGTMAFHIQQFTTLP